MTVPRRRMSPTSVVIGYYITRLSPSSYLIGCPVGESPGSDFDWLFVLFRYEEVCVTKERRKEEP